MSEQRPRQWVTRADGARVTYDVAGSGQPLLLVPGLGQSSRQFGTLPRTLSRLGYRAISYDPPGLGHGATEDAPEWTVPGALSDMVAVLDAEGLGRCRILASSMGGKLALAFAAEHGDRIEEAFLYGTEALLGGRAHAVYQMFEALYAQAPAAVLTSCMRPLLFGRTFLAKHAWFVAEILAAWQPNEIERRTALAQIRAVLATDFTGLLPSVAARIVCHAGLEDTLVEPADVRATASLLPQAELVEVPAAGHSMLLENAEVSLAALR